MSETEKNSILIVDDEKSNLKFLTRILKDEYTIFTAKSGRDAIKKADDLLPDLILLDIIMPEMNGHEVVASLKESKRTREIPVIFISVLGDSEDEERGLNLEAADYISKPFAPEVVKLRVRNQIQTVNQLRASKHLSMTDQLTNMPNRRSFDNHFNMEWSHAMRVKAPISILMLDVDKFKNFNDTYGHELGDLVLQTAAKVITQTLKRPTDFAARWGGEEFIVLLRDTGISGALDIAERIRRNVESAQIPCADGTMTHITISIGIAVQETMPCVCSISEFLSKADKALYTAKETGRNRVCLYNNRD